IAVVYAVGRADRLTTLFGGPVLQYLGRISYSLYLVHWFVKEAVMNLGFHLTRGGRLAGVGWFLLAAASSIMVAHLLHIGVERPSMRWSRTLKQAMQPR